VDKIQTKIETLLSGNIPIFEPGLADLVKENVKANRLNFTLDTAQAVKSADAVFIAVGTPPHPEHGHADMKYVHAAAQEIAEHMDGFTVIVNKSTVPVGTGQGVEDIISETAPSKNFTVASNPEFLREGAAIGDFMEPDRIVVGPTSDKAKDIMAKIYKPLTKKGFPLLFTTRESAELIKYASNAFLATKISFINEMADLCEQVGGDVDEVAKGMGLDTRIGNKFLQAGPGYGGSCFPKDTLALIKTSKDHGVDMQIVKAAAKANDERKLAMAHKIIEACGGSVNGKTISILGLTFKANTDDMRDAPSLSIIPELLKHGAIIKAYDPKGIEDAKTHFGETITYCQNIEKCIIGVTAISILTEWNEFLQIKNLNLNVPVIDLRGMFNSNDFSNYTTIGK
jgi:UDPglucose 6-dehydrogenase